MRFFLWFSLSFFVCLPSSSARRLDSDRPLPTYLPKAGEFLRFRAKAGEIEGGSATLEIRQILGSHPKPPILQASLLARTNSFFDKIHKIHNLFTSTFLLTPRLPFSHEMDVDQAGMRHKLQMSFQTTPHQGQIRVKTTPLPRTPHSRVSRPWETLYRVPHDTKDLVSALYTARSFPFQRNKTFTLHLFVTGQLWRVEGSVLRTETLQTFLGTRKALVIAARGWQIHQPRFTRDATIWLSADADRIPFKIQSSLAVLGSITAELTAYRSDRKQPLREESSSSRWGGLLGSF